ncbi:MAG: hypothetical protein OXH75_13945 [Acidobacteria bacterium]|nr:hypothetical protein [Acidobacteriota bacterium]
MGSQDRKRPSEERRGLTSQRILALAMLFILVSMGALLWYMPFP